MFARDALLQPPLRMASSSRPACLRLLPAVSGIVDVRHSTWTSTRAIGGRCVVAVEHRFVIPSARHDASAARSGVGIEGPFGAGRERACCLFLRRRHPLVASRSLSSFPSLSEAATDTALDATGRISEETCGEVDPASVDEGERYYRRALSALRESKRVEEELQSKRAAEQFDAMRNATTTGPSADGGGGGRAEGGRRRSSSAGVAVVRTIARQVRKDRSRASVTDGKVDQRGDEINGDGDESWEAIARRNMEEAAYRHGHPAALVRLGNAALDEARHHHRGESDRLMSIDSVARVYDAFLQGEDNGAPTVDFSSLRDAADDPLELAQVLYRMAGERGSAEGWYNLGHLLWTGQQSVPTAEGTVDDDDRGAATDDAEEWTLLPNREAALDAFDRAVQLGDPDAMYFLGVQYLSFEEGSDEHRRRRGFDLIRSAADEGHGGALHYLALVHRNGDDSLGVAPCNSDEFRSRLDRAADAADPDALFLRAHCQFHGEDGYDVDYAAALNNFLQSAKGGNPDAAVSAGAMLHRGGFGGAVQRDQRRAFELYQEAAERGSIEGWRNVAACYALGEGVPRCERTAKHISKTMLKGDDDR